MIVLLASVTYGIIESPTALATPPPGVSALGHEDLGTLRRMLATVTAP